MHFYEASIITTRDGIHCQVYGNEHPVHCILVKPKYIPTDKIESKALPCRFITGRKMNRLNMWVDKGELKKYLKAFKKAYPDYIFTSDLHKGRRLFFAVPIDKIERVYFPGKGLSELMKIPKKHLDKHLTLVYKFSKFLLKSGLEIDDLGVTYSTLMGHYYWISDMNFVVYGKENFWKLMKYLETARHPLLRWKTKEDWLKFYRKRNRLAIFNEDKFLHLMSKKKSEGYFGDILFVIFGTEKEEEVWFKWGEEKYSSLGLATVEGTVVDNFSSVVRPGYYQIKDSKILDSSDNVRVKKIVFYSRDYTMIAYPGEKIMACGILEKVKPKKRKPYYRVVVGYFDAYITQRREKEFIKVI